MVDLYKRFQRGVSYYLARQLGQRADVENRLHETFLIVVDAIQRDEILDPNALGSFVRTVVRCQIAKQVEERMKERNRKVDVADIHEYVADQQTNPEEECRLSERAAQVRRALAGLRELDRTILIRFYVDEKSADEVCSELGITKNQFRNLKNRARDKIAKVHSKFKRTALLPVVPVVAAEAAHA